MSILSMSQEHPSYLIELQWGPRWPPHLLVDEAIKVTDFRYSLHIGFTDSVEGLSRGIEMLEEYHYRARG